MTQSKIDRRTMIAGAAALPFMALPAAASVGPAFAAAPTITDAMPDAKLIVLGQRIERLAAEYAPLRREACKCYATIEDDLILSSHQCLKDNDFEKRNSRHRYLYKKSGYGKAIKRSGPVGSKLVKAAQKAMKYQPQSLGGLAAQAQAVNALVGFFGDEESDDYIAQFLAAVARLGGTSLTDVSDEALAAV